MEIHASWDYTSDGTGGLFNFEYTPVTLYAQWPDNAVHQMVFFANGGEPKETGGVKPSLIRYVADGGTVSGVEGIRAGHSFDSR